MEWKTNDNGTIEVSSLVYDAPGVEAGETNRSTTATAVIQSDGSYRVDLVDTFLQALGLDRFKEELANGKATDVKEAKKACEEAILAARKEGPFKKDRVGLYGIDAIEAIVSKLLESSSYEFEFDTCDAIHKYAKISLEANGETFEYKFELGTEDIEHPDGGTCQSITITNTKVDPMVELAKMFGPTAYDIFVPVG